MHSRQAAGWKRHAARDMRVPGASSRCPECLLGVRAARVIGGWGGETAEAQWSEALRVLLGIVCACGRCLRRQLRAEQPSESGMQLHDGACTGHRVLLTPLLREDLLHEPAATRARVGGSSRGMDGARQRDGGGA